MIAVEEVTLDSVKCNGLVASFPSPTLLKHAVLCGHRGRAMDKTMGGGLIGEDILPAGTLDTALKF